MTTQDYTVRSNRGAARIWIEGSRLVSAGFTRGRYFTLSHDGATLKLSLVADKVQGARKVSGKDIKPIIDLTGKTVPFAIGTAVTVLYCVNDNSIVIKAN